MQELQGVRVAVAATDGFEEAELTSPVEALKSAGAQVDILSSKPGEIQGFRHHDKSRKVKVDRTLDAANPGDYDALVLPGGALNADTIRMEGKLLDMVREFDRAGKPIAAICHAPWVLVSAGVLKGRKLTSYFTIQDDIRNAGAEWADQEVQRDRNLVTSRQPDDLPAFNREMIRMFSEARGKVRHA